MCSSSPLFVLPTIVPASCGLSLPPRNGLTHKPGTPFSFLLFSLHRGQSPAAFRACCLPCTSKARQAALGKGCGVFPSSLWGAFPAVSAFVSLGLLECSLGETLHLKEKRGEEESGHYAQVLDAKLVQTTQIHGFPAQSGALQWQSCTRNIQVPGALRAAGARRTLRCPQAVLGCAGLYWAAIPPAWELLAFPQARHDNCRL